MRVFRISGVVAVALLAVSCSHPTLPESSLVSRYRGLDAEVRADGVMLRWGSFISEYDVEGSRRTVEQPAQVVIERSTEGAASSFRIVARHPGGIEQDSLLLPLPAGEETRYRVSWLAKSYAPLFISLPSEVTTPVVSAVRTIALPQASRWSGLDWSPDGTRLLSTRSLAFTELDNVIIDATNGSTTLLPLPPGGSESLGDCRWSPSGNWIAFWSTPRLTSYLLDYRVWIARASGDSMSMVSETGSWVPAWGVQDSTLAFLRRDQILVTNPFRAGALRALPISKNRGIRGLSVRSVDGRIAYAAYEESGLAETHLYDTGPAGGEPTRLTGDAGTNDDSPAWSPDGSRIAFISNRSGHRDVWLLERAGGRVRQLTSGQHFVREAASLAWSPDGLEVAVLENLNYQDWRIAFYHP